LVPFSSQGVRAAAATATTAVFFPLFSFLLSFPHLLRLFAELSSIYLQLLTAATTDFHKSIATHSHKPPHRGSAKRLSVSSSFLLATLVPFNLSSRTDARLVLALVLLSRVVSFLSSFRGFVTRNKTK
jgi:hypothetical protein